MLTAKVFRDWFSANSHDFDALVFDIDGVLTVGNQLADDASGFLASLRDRQFPFGLLTNDARHSRQEKAERLCRRGLDVRPEEITSSGHGLEELAAGRGLVGERFFVMGDLGEPCYAGLAGMRTTRDIAEMDTCRGVIVSERNFDWEVSINAAINYFLDHPEGLLIVPNPDEFFMTDRLHVRMASGAPAHLIAHILALFGPRIEPIVLGKPHLPIFAHNHRILEERFGLAALRKERVLMIGDSIRSDIAGANAFGYRSALVMTGITTPQVLADATPYPDHVFERL